MKKRLFEFTCPHCHASFFLPRDTYLIRDEGSAEYERLKEGTYFLHQCQNCHELFTLEYPLVFRDPRTKTSLICSESNPQGFEGKVVLTRSSAQFLEAFSILDAGLPLRQTLAVKRRLENELQAKLQIVEYDAEHKILWFDQQGKLIGAEFFVHKENAGSM